MDDFDLWMEEHKKKCPQCRKTMDEDNSVGICHEAFEMLKECLGGKKKKG